MIYNNVEKAAFIKRQNRFTADIFVNGKTEVCHVKNTGRLSELLVCGAEIYVQRSEKPERKTAYDLVTVLKDGKFVNIDSFAPNVVTGEYLAKKYPQAKIIREKKFGNSRFDFYMESDEGRGFIEVKGVTLFRDGKALFPDAPTERGIKHLLELCECVKQGYFAKVYFIIASDSEGKLIFSPNRKIGNDFADALIRARQAGVEICAFDCKCGGDFLDIKDRIGVELV